MTLTPDFWLWLLACALIVIGIAGTLLPMLPGLPLVFGGMLLGAWIDGFQRVGTVALTVLAALTVVGIVLDFLGGAIGAKKIGASRAAVVGATIGTFFGMFLGFPGLLLGPFAGALAGELSARRGLTTAGRVALGTWLGILVVTLFKLALAFAMLGIFVFSYFFAGDGPRLA